MRATKKFAYQLLKKYESIFDGSLGKWKTEPVDFDLVDGAVPHSQQHYPIPWLYQETFKRELDQRSIGQDWSTRASTTIRMGFANIYNT